MKRIMIFTGKGGVGKTSVAAAHGRASALEGKKTLVVSTDMAHNLGDIFQMELGRQELKIADNLYGLEIDPTYMMDHEFANIMQAMKDMITSSGFPTGDLDYMDIFPGMEELVSLLKIMNIYKNEDYERIIVDCAPTGETLSLLKFPELMTWYIEKFFPIGKVAMRVMKPVAKAIYKIDLPNQKAMTDIEKVFVQLIDLQQLLKDRERTTIRLVTIPEKMVVEETKRSYMYLSLYDFAVDGVFINRILPRDMENPFFDKWLKIQEAYIEEIEAVFAHVPIYRIPWFDTDINGLSGVDRIVDEVFDKYNIFQRIKEGKRESYYKNQDGYGLKLYIPGLDKEKLDIHESQVDVIIKIGNFKRNIPKPNTLRNYQIASANFNEDELTLSFCQN